MESGVYMHGPSRNVQCGSMQAARRLGSVTGGRGGAARSLSLPFTPVVLNGFLALTLA